VTEERAGGPYLFGAEVSAARRRGSPDELRQWLTFAQSCADDSDGMAMAAFRRDLRISTKPDKSLVTQADRGIEAHVRSRIADTYPDHGVVGEEYGTSEGGAAVRWYIDPIDGTHNFVRDIPVWASLIAVERDGELQAGVVSAPALGSRWWASRGGGAWALAPGDDPAHPRRIRTSAVADLAASQLLTSSAVAVAASGLAPGIMQLLGRVWRDRGFGDFWGYGLVAEGAAEAMVEIGPLAWDLAAPTIVLEEAGGMLTDLDGRRTIHAGNAVATNGLLHAQVLRALAETAGG
jgi:histidinol-phosphatase